MNNGFRGRYGKSGGGNNKSNSRFSPHGHDGLSLGDPEPLKVSDTLVRPENVSDEDWEVYKAEVVQNEEIGFPNPLFNVRKPWEKPTSSRFVR